MITVTEEFDNWYESGRSIFLNGDFPEYSDHIKDMHISMSFGVYQRFFLEKYGWTIYVKPAYDKFSIHIEKGLDKETLLNRSLINNNYNSVQSRLVDEAFKLTEK